MEEETSLKDILAAHRGKVANVVNVDLPTVKLVIFVVNDDWYAFYGENIKEILPATNVYFLPCCPAFLEGVINVRGDIESVLNLRVLLRYSYVDDEHHSRILIAQGKQIRSGIRVDCVEEVIDILEEQVKPPSHTIPEHLRSIVIGHFNLGEKIVSLLDVDHLFELNFAHHS